MDWQQITSLFIVALATGLLVRGWWRRRRTGGHAGCVCPGTGSGSVQGSIVYHARKGERTEVIVKMK
jgi:hypothetical protein